MANRGNIRHVLTTDDYNESTVWERGLTEKNSTRMEPIGERQPRVCDAIARVDIEAAKQLAKEYIDDLRAGDYRKGTDFELHGNVTIQNLLRMQFISPRYPALYCI